MRYDRAALVKSLERCRPALKTGDKITPFAHIWFDDDVVLANGLDFGIQAPFDSGLQLGVPGKQFLGILASASADAVDLTPEKHKLRIEFGGTKVSLPSLPIQACVWPFPGDRGRGRHTLTRSFLDGLRETLRVKVAVPTRVEHHGVVLYPSERGLALVATDSSVLVQAMVEDVELPAKFARVILPRNFVEQVVAQCTPGAAFGLFDDHYFAEGDGASIFVRAIQRGGSQSLTEVVAAHTPRAFAPVPAALDEALDRARMLCGEKEEHVTVVADSTLRLSGTYQYGELAEELPLDEPLPDTAMIQVSLPYLLTGLKHAGRFGIAPRAFTFQGGQWVYVLAGR